MEDEKIEEVKNWLEPISVRDIQIFLGFANFYGRFIQSFSKIARPLILMLRTSLTFIVLQLLIDAVGKNEAYRDESISNEINSSNLSAFKMFTEVNYLTSEGAKKDGGNPNSDGNSNSGDNFNNSGNHTKNDIKAAKSSDYLTSDIKKAFNFLWYTFTQAPIFQHLDLKRHIWIKTNMSSYAIGRI